MATKGRARLPCHCSPDTLQVSLLRIAAVDTGTHEQTSKRLFYVGYYVG
jgi:hypothetical protein